jgi:hypothetical protein
MCGFNLSFPKSGGSDEGTSLQGPQKGLPIRCAWPDNPLDHEQDQETRQGKA